MNDFECETIESILCWVADTFCEGVLTIPGTVFITDAPKYVWRPGPHGLGNVLITEKGARIMELCEKE